MATTSISHNFDDDLFSVTELSPLSPDGFRGVVPGCAAFRAPLPILETKKCNTITQKKW
uniref:Uncharacterized protein n=1 Tax=Ascaris lumbricoides TaxID=6252 RepID=A0A0M3I7V4_ASCLU